MNDSNSPKKTDEDSAGKEEVIQEEDIGEVRHDEPVTAKGIVRALFMADEPEQRMNVVQSEDETDPKSDDSLP